MNYPKIKVVITKGVVNVFTSIASDVEIVTDGTRLCYPSPASSEAWTVPDPQTKIVIIPPEDVRIGDTLVVEGYDYKVFGIHHDEIGNGSVDDPKPRRLYDVEWTGNGREPGPGYRRMQSGCAYGWHMAVRRPA